MKDAPDAKEGNNTDEPDDFLFRAIRGEIGRTLEHAAPTAFARYEKEGSLDALLDRRAKSLLPDVERRLKAGMSLTEAFFQLAPDIYPSEAEYPAEESEW